MSANNAPFAIASSALAINGAVNNVNLGRQWIINGAGWRLVKAAGALTLPGRKLLVSAISGGLPTYIATTTVTANDYLGVGFAPAGQVTLATGDAFLVQTSGYGEGISAAAIAAGAAVGASTTAGKIDDASITAVGTFGISLESAAGADENVGIRIVNLI